jgi:hypothetical protein
MELDMIRLLVWLLLLFAAGKRLQTITGQTLLLLATYRFDTENEAIHTRFMAASQSGAIVAANAKPCTLSKTNHVKAFQIQSRYRRHHILRRSPFRRPATARQRAACPWQSMEHMDVGVSQRAKLIMRKDRIVTTAIVPHAFAHCPGEGSPFQAPRPVRFFLSMLVRKGCPPACGKPGMQRH